MPAGDGTGPMGMGPMTGRGMGFCTNDTIPGPRYPMPGRGRAWGGGQGRGGGGGRHGWRHQFRATGLPFWARGEAAPEVDPPEPSAEPGDEVQTLRHQMGLLEQALEQLRQRIATVESQAKEN